MCVYAWHTCVSVGRLQIVHRIVPHTHTGSHTPHTHTHTHTVSHTPHTHTHTHTHRLTHSSHTHTHTHTHTQAHTLRTHTHAHKQGHTLRTHANTHTHTHTHGPMHLHTHKHKHVHTICACLLKTLTAFMCGCVCMYINICNLPLHVYLSAYRHCLDIHLTYMHTYRSLLCPHGSFLLPCAAHAASGQYVCMYMYVSVCEWSMHVSV